MNAKQRAEGLINDLRLTYTEEEITQAVINLLTTMKEGNQE
jgi:hypothetical protein